MLNVEKLTKKLSDGRALLNGISFRVARGEFVGVLGASGAGTRYLSLPSCSVKGSLSASSNDRSSAPPSPPFFFSMACVAA